LPAARSATPLFEETHLSQQSNRHGVSGEPSLFQQKNPRRVETDEFDISNDEPDVIQAALFSFSSVLAQGTAQPCVSVPMSSLFLLFH
jgi:hypothetical protein